MEIERVLEISIDDEGDWFKNVFVTGPGFQIAQIFVENIFEKHVNWTELLQKDDNYKNILQVKMQKEFKVTPVYLTIDNTLEDGYHMGVYLVLGESPVHLSHCDAIPFSHFNSYEAIHGYYEKNNFAFIFLGEDIHKIKKKAEQGACEKAIIIIEKALS